MLISTCDNGTTCVYDLPEELTINQFNALITGYEMRDYLREELYNQPKLKGYNGPMFNGYKYRKSNGERVVVIRYEKAVKRNDAI